MSDMTSSAATELILSRRSSNRLDQHPLLSSTSPTQRPPPRSNRRDLHLSLRNVAPVSSEPRRFPGLTAR
ncbi:hypothetical protein RSOLAG1IB_09708 [Rhizoctonia solani AG-1 IB]|uniref:Uncharacterized protein n=1 Tax=Thanatephorus cucumeris (strain AG1-IB / isolate 7/3/14) TaxID=1108050 RepID=A0A0B7FRB9_THACB|nr:hypothetical protein RSOLAG1IB_09708 [Rhizoctonia solani AG-1 IB]